MQCEHFICGAPALNSRTSRHEFWSDELVYRSAALERAEADEKNRTASFSAASETPVPRHDGDEVLEISESAIDFSRLRASAPVLLYHDTARQIGVVERAWISSKKLHVTSRFSQSAEADAVFRDVIEGIRRNVSIGYLVHERTRISGGYRVTRWEPMEVSIVSVPADITVGIGRSRSRRDAFDSGRPPVREYLSHGKSTGVEVQKICRINSSLMVPGSLALVNFDTAMELVRDGSARIIAMPRTQ